MRGCQGGLVMFSRTCILVCVCCCLFVCARVVCACVCVCMGDIPGRPTVAMMSFFWPSVVQKRVGWVRDSAVTVHRGAHGLVHDATGTGAVFRGTHGPFRCRIDSDSARGRGVRESPSSSDELPPKLSRSPSSPWLVMDDGDVAASAMATYYSTAATCKDVKTVITWADKHSLVVASCSRHNPFRTISQEILITHVAQCHRRFRNPLLPLPSPAQRPPPPPPLPPSPLYFKTGPTILFRFA